MKKEITSLLCILLLAQVHAQNDQQTKILNEAKRKIDSLMKNNPDKKRYAGSNSKVNASVTMPNVPASMPASLYAKNPDTAFLSKIQFPAPCPRR